jgi:hypothetical protein
VDTGGACDMMQSMPSRVPWLRRDQWDLFRTSYADPAELHSSYEEWLMETENSIRVFQRAGLSVLRVDVDIPEWLAWCKEERRRTDAQALLLFMMTKVVAS